MFQIWFLERAAFITCQWHILMMPSFVCLMAPGLHLSLARQCRDIAETLQRRTWPSLADMMRVSFLTRYEVTPWHHNDAIWLLVLGQLAALEPNLPGVARTERRTYVWVVRNLGWVCASEARQLELGSTASLRGALHGSRVDYTAMAPRLVWQQLTLDLSSPPPSSGTHVTKNTHTH